MQHIPKRIRIAPSDLFFFFFSLKATQFERMILYGLDQHDLAQAMSYKSRKLRDAAIVGD